MGSTVNQVTSPTEWKVDALCCASRAPTFGGACSFAGSSAADDADSAESCRDFVEKNRDSEAGTVGVAEDSVGGGLDGADCEQFVIVEDCVVATSSGGYRHECFELSDTADRSQSQASQVDDSSSECYCYNRCGLSHIHDCY